MKNKLSYRFIFPAILLNCLSPPILYATIQNGDFSAGLAGWTVEYGTVTDGGGYALFQEHPTVILSTLRRHWLCSQAFYPPLAD